MDEKQKHDFNKTRCAFEQWNQKSKDDFTYVDLLINWTLNNYSGNAVIVVNF